MADVLVHIKGVDQLSGVLGGVQKKVGSLGATMRGVGGIAGGFLLAGGVQAGVQKLTGFVNDSIAAAKEAAAVEAQLGAVLASTGGKAGVSADMAKSLAKRYQSLTNFEDDLVLSTENMLLTFTSVGKDIFPAATQAALDMATAMKEDPVSASIRLGKALNDPISGVTALRKVGVQLTKQQMDQIKVFMEAGDQASAQKIILKELAVEFGGSAEAAVKADGGITQMNNKMKDMQEQIGKKLIPVQLQWKKAQMAALNWGMTKLAPWLKIQIDKYYPDIKDALNDIKPVLTTLFKAFLAGLKTIGPPLGDFVKFILNHKPLLIAAIAAIGTAIVVAFGPGAIAVAAIVGIITLVGLVRDNWDMLQAKTTAIFNSLPGPVRAAMQIIYSFTKARIEGVIQVFRSMYTIIDGIIKLVDAVIHGRWAQAWAALKQIAAGALGLLLGNIKASLGNIPAIIIRAIAGVAAAAGKLGAALGSGIANAVKGGINSMIGYFESGLNGIIKRWNGLEFKVPHVDLGPLGKIGGGTIGVPDIPLVHIPRLRKGAFDLLGDTLAQLHRGEMVVPQPFAEGFRAQLRHPVTAGGGGDFNFYGDIHLGGRATKEDATALLDMVEAEWRARRRRGM